MQLFVQSARRACDGFVLTAADGPAVLGICRLVEGLPLAVELAASWSRVLTCHEIARELEVGLDVLTTVLRDVPTRHRSMRAVFDQSWRLLPAGEQRVLRRLAVFRGGFDREAAVAVAEASLPDLAGLVDRALLRWAGPRYDLHELVRHYAHEQLESVDEAAEMHERHLRWCLALSERAEPWLRGPEQEVWLVMLDAEHDNLRAALDWAQTHERGETVVRLGGALWWFWFMRGHMDEGRGWLEAMLRVERDPPNGTRRQAVGASAARRRVAVRAPAYVCPGHRAAGAQPGRDDSGGGHPRGAMVLLDLGNAVRMQGQYRRAIDLFERAATIARQSAMSALRPPRSATPERPGTKLATTGVPGLSWKQVWRCRVAVATHTTWAGASPSWVA